MLIFFEFSEFWNPLFTFATISSIAVGSISAIYQKRLKRLFAYSTIAHTGFILLGIVGASPESTKTLVFYLMVYSLLSILLFSLLIFTIIASTRFPA
jgi:NADH-quinone oxidoreductase subunit N